MFELIECLKDTVLSAMYFMNEPAIRGTDTATALRTAVDDVFTTGNGDRNDIPDVIIVISDGQSNINRQGTQVEAQRARDAGIRVISVAMGVDVEMGEMNGIATDPDDNNVFVMTSVNDVDQTGDRILDELCTIWLVENYTGSM